MDRYASLKKVWGEYYSQGGLILTDRYTTSNAVHQGAKCAPQERPAFLGWLDDFEHDKLGLPRADLVLYLDMPTRCSLELLRSREAATHTQGDIHEVDPDYLAACRDSALQAAPAPGLAGHPLRHGGRPPAHGRGDPPGGVVPGLPPVESELRRSSPMVYILLAEGLKRPRP